MANILITDDSLVQLLILERTLVKNGHRVYKASNGHDAIEAIKSSKIDILITDIFMPVVDGVELIMKTKEIDSSIGIIAISGGGNLIKEVSYLEYVKEFGADFSFIKPVEDKDLLDAIEYLTE